MNHELKTWIDATLRARDEAAAAEEARKAERERLEREGNLRYCQEILTKWQVPLQERGGKWTPQCTEEGYPKLLYSYLVPLVGYIEGQTQCYGINIIGYRDCDGMVTCQTAEDFAAWLRDRLQYEADEAAFADG